MRKLITAALLTASFTATAGDRGAYVLHLRTHTGASAQVATFFLQIHGQQGMPVGWNADGNRQDCQTTAELMNKILAETEPKAEPHSYWCERE